MQTTGWSPGARRGEDLSVRIQEDFVESGNVLDLDWDGGDMSNGLFKQVHLIVYKGSLRSL